MPFPSPLILLLALFPALAFASPLQVENVAPGVYVHHGEHKDINVGYGGDICNISFVVGTKVVAVIDTGGSPKIGARLREAIRSITQLPILYVINTHVHPDHSLGNAAFKQDNPVFVGHDRLAEVMAQRREAYLRNEPQWVGTDDAAGTELIAPALTIAGTRAIDLGGRTLRLTAYPVAHSPADVSVFDTASKTLWTGDLLFIERTPSIDGDLPGWLNVIEQLRKNPVSHVVPGHGPASANLDAALNDEKRYLTTLLSDVRAAIKRGDSMEQTIATAAKSEEGKWVLFDVVNRRNVALVFPALEWE
ncbi:MAG: quinoprotein relay system zinc metallohydrolase 2 [Gammaproteobacteria bacterium]|nr:quinoprotein relay system zinc metallohydrolase 2 [Gammaproteobacteria bacterium]MBU1480596.1 quinoprotein relay system zinc metallohydrolase 2 [Gammaproteobacteria bacterium]